MFEFLRCKAFSGSAALDARFAYPGSTPHYAPDRTFGTRHIRLELSLELAKQSLQGRCTTRLVALSGEARTMTFDAVHFKGLTVTSDGRPVKHTYDGRKLQLFWPKAFRRNATVDVIIRYKVTRPPLGLHFVGPDRQYPNKPAQVWTQGEDEYNRYWF